MENKKKALPENDVNKNKPVQEDKSTSKQKPMGSESDVEQNEKYLKSKEHNTNNSVGIKK